MLSTAPPQDLVTLFGHLLPLVELNRTALDSVGQLDDVGRTTGFKIFQGHSSNGRQCESKISLEAVRVDGSGREQSRIASSARGGGNGVQTR